MKEIIILTVITGAAFFTFGLTLGFGIIRNNKNLKITSFVLFITSIVSATWTGYEVTTRSYNRIAGIFTPREGDEIYDALFDKRKSNCVKVLNYQDQVVPKIDYAIWLHFEAFRGKIRN